MNAAEQNSAVGAAMVVGGGIGGMQAALDLAEAGIKVYLVETKPPSAAGWPSSTRRSRPTTAPCAPWRRGWWRSAGISDIEILTLSGRRTGRRAGRELHE